MKRKPHAIRRVPILPGLLTILLHLAQPILAQTGPSITQQPASQTNLAGGSVIFSVAASGTGPFAYQWQFNGAPFPLDLIATVAGDGPPGFSGDGVEGDNASLNDPVGSAVDASGNVYIADMDNHRVRKVDSSGIITTVAGNGSAGFSGDGGAAGNASLREPSGVAVDASGNLFIADQINNRIRKVDANGIITTLAGNGASGYSGDGGAAASASLWHPQGVALDGFGNLFIADSGNSVVRRVGTNGLIGTVAGGGSPGYSGDGGPATEARLTSPSGVAVDGSGNLFVADPAGAVIRRVDARGIITTLAGNGSQGFSGDGGAATNAGLRSPFGVAVDGSGNLWIADNLNERVRRVDTNGIITTAAGNGSDGYSGDGVVPTSASLWLPQGVAVDSSGNLFIADSGNNRVRSVSLAGFPNLRLDNLTAEESGDYQVVVTGPAGSVTSAVASLTVLAPPVLLGFSLVGPSATLSVEAAGAPPLYYFWFGNGTDLVQSGTSGTLAAANESPDYFGYSVVITNIFGSVTSAVASLTVLGEPSILRQPASLVLDAGATASLSVTAIGTPPLYYNWYRNGLDLEAGTNSTVSFPATITETGVYTVVVANAFGSVTSRGAAVTVGSPPVINQQPASQTGSAGSSATLSVGFSGVGPFRYQWRQNGTNLADDLISTVAGAGPSGLTGDGGPATDAALQYPSGVAVDASGNLFIADYYNHRVRKVDLNGDITTVAGNGVQGYSGDQGPAPLASLNYPSGVAVDAEENLFIADSGNNRIRKVSVSGLINTLAGSGSRGYSGDGGPATNAAFDFSNGPWATVALDPSGGLYIGDGGNAVVRRVDTNGVITTVAGKAGSFGFSGDGGPATNATFNGALGVGTDAFGDLFIADGGNNRIREVDTTGVIRTVAGDGSGYDSGDGGPATNAGLSDPFSVAVDAYEDLYIADLFGNRVREVDLNGNITTVAGNGSGGFFGDDGLATQAGLDFPSGVALDPFGNLYIADMANSRVREVDFGSSPIITTAAGNGYAGFYGDGGPAIQAGLDSPSGVAADGSGNLYIADLDNNRVRQVDTNGNIATLAGSGPGILPDKGLLSLLGGRRGTYSGDGGPAAYAGLSLPSGVAVDDLGNVFIADKGNNVIRQVDVNGMITTIAGNTVAGYCCDGGPATNASLNTPSSVAVDAGGNLFIADEANNRVRRVDLNGIITTVAGNGLQLGFGGSGGSYSGDGGPATNAGLNFPSGVAVDASGDLLIADMNNYRVRKIDPQGIITTVAGNGSGTYSGDGGPATNAGLNLPSGVAVDASGNIFIAEEAGNRIRHVDTNGIISTVAGNGAQGYSGDGGPAVKASLNLAGSPAPVGLAVDGSGNLFIPDEGNNVIREVPLGGFPTLAFDSLVVGDIGDYQLVIDSPFGSVTSLVASVAVLSPPVILAQPLGAFVVAGGTAALNVEAAGGQPLSYAWSLAGSGVVQNGTNSALVLSNASLAQSGSYVVVVTNLFGSVTSLVATLSVGLAPSVTNVTAGQTVAAGGSVTFSMAAGGTGPLSYQWRFNGTNLPAHFITTVAGNGAYDYSGDGAAATNASLAAPAGLAEDADGDLFIADVFNNRIRKVDRNGVITTVAGNGSQIYAGDGGPAVRASLSSPQGVAVDGAGDVFIADTGNQAVRKVDPHGVITTVAGNGNQGYAGDGGPATNAALSLALPDNSERIEGGGLAVDSAGSLFIADSGNNVIRKVDAGGIITTVAGNGARGYFGDGGAATNARLAAPQGVLVDALGNLLVADTGNNVIRKVDGRGVITTVAGNGLPLYAGDGGAATNASLGAPSGLALDAAGNLFIADQGNQRVRIVEAGGTISTVAGDGSQGYSGDGGPAVASSLDNPAAAFVEASGNLFIADSGNNRIRKVPLLGFPTLSLTGVSAASAGAYQLVVASPYGSVTSALASLTVLSPTNQNAGLALSIPVVSGGSLLLNFSASQTLSSVFTLLQAGSVAGPWSANTAAALTTNSQTGGFQFSIPIPVSTEFYRIRSP